MKNVSKFLPVLVLTLFTTSTSNFGISEEEKQIIECNRTLDRMQEEEASWSYKINEFGASAVCLGGGIVSMIALSIISAPEKDAKRPDLRYVFSNIASVIGLGFGSKLVMDAQRSLETRNKKKKSLIEKREKAEVAMKALQTKNNNRMLSKTR